jgi:hypothetical protein
MPSRPRAWLPCFIAWFAFGASHCALANDPGEADSDAAIAIDAASDVVPHEAFSTATPVDEIAWSIVGTGVSFEDTRNPNGENAFVAFAGYGVSDDAARSWVEAMYDASLRARGVRERRHVRPPGDRKLAVDRNATAACIGGHAVRRRRSPLERGVGRVRVVYVAVRTRPRR